MRFDRETILNLWHDWWTSPAIAAQVGATAEYVRTVVQRARRDGDARANRRRNSKNDLGLEIDTNFPQGKIGLRTERPPVTPGAPHQGEYAMQRGRDAGIGHPASPTNSNSPQAFGQMTADKNQTASMVEPRGSGWEGSLLPEKYQRRHPIICHAYVCGWLTYCDGVYRPHGPYADGAFADGWRDAEKLKKSVQPLGGYRHGKRKITAHHIFMK